MKINLLVLTFLFSISSKAAFYSVTAEVLKNSAPGESFTVTTMEGVPAKIQTSNKDHYNYLNIDVAGQSKDSILLKLSFGEFRYNLTKELYHPNLIVKNNEESVIEFVDDDDNQYKLKLKAQKIKQAHRP